MSLIELWTARDDLSIEPYRSITVSAQLLERAFDLDTFTTICFMSKESERSIEHRKEQMCSNFQLLVSKTNMKRPSTLSTIESVCSLDKRRWAPPRVRGTLLLLPAVSSFQFRSSWLETNKTPEACVQKKRPVTKSMLCIDRADQRGSLKKGVLKQEINETLNIHSKELSPKKMLTSRQSMDGANLLKQTWAGHRWCCATLHHTTKVHRP